MIVSGEKEGNTAQKCESVRFATAQKQLVLEAFGEEKPVKLCCDNSYGSSIFTAKRILLTIVCQELGCNSRKHESFLCPQRAHS